MNTKQWKEGIRSKVKYWKIKYPPPKKTQTKTKKNKKKKTKLNPPPPQKQKYQKKKQRTKNKLGWKSQNIRWGRHGEEKGVVLREFLVQVGILDI